MRQEDMNMSEQMTRSKAVNGVNVEDLFKTLDAIKAAPVIAKFKFRIQNEWQDGGHNRSTIKNFYGAGGDVERPKAFTLDADEPPLLLGTDKGPNPVEYLLTGIAACVTTAIVYHGAAKGIEIEELESTVGGNIDLRGFLGLDKNVRAGYESIQMKFRIKTNASDEQLRELMESAPKLSPVFDSVTKGVPITVTAERK
jgi:uncharacterized OsmC-like protein